MSLEEEVNQSVSRTLSLAEAADAAAAAEQDGDEKEDDLDLALLAPPAPETVANGDVAPPQAQDERSPLTGRPGLGGRRGGPAAGPDTDQFDGPAPVGGLLPASGGSRGPVGRPDPAPPLGANTGRLGGGKHEGNPRPTIPVGGAQSAGRLGDPLADRDVSRGNGLIDPDEPTEGIRLLQ